MKKKITSDFSVLMSVYFKENPFYFKTALDSIVNQTLLPNEIVLIKDGPLCEELEKVINEYIFQYPNLFKVIFKIVAIEIVKNIVNKTLSRCILSSLYV